MRTAKTGPDLRLNTKFRNGKILIDLRDLLKLVDLDAD